MKRVFRRVLRGTAGVGVLLALVACALQVSHSERTDGSDPVAQDTLRIASYNVHYIVLGLEDGPWSVGDWDRRKGPMDMAFKAVEADIIAFQEMESWSRGSDGSVNLARDFLAERNPEYGVAASGDWQSFPSTQPVFYRKSKVQPIEQGWFFFSDTPDVIYSRTFNGSFPTFASWVQFEALDTGQTFRVVNVHFEYRGRSNRRLSAALVRDRISPWITGGENVFLVGDLNALYGAHTMQILEEAGITFDRIPGATYHLSRGVHLFGAIDHLGRTPLVRIANAPVVVQQKSAGEWPSDHHPIYADYVLPQSQE